MIFKEKQSFSFARTEPSSEEDAENLTEKIAEEVFEKFEEVERIIAKEELETLHEHIEDKLESKEKKERAQLRKEEQN